MSLPLVVDTMLSVGRHYSMDVRNLRDLAIKVVILSLKYVDRRALWAAVFEDAFVDWPLVPPARNLLGDLHLWLPLLDLFTWEGLERHEAAHPPLANMRRALRAAGLDPGDPGLGCQLLILQLLHGIVSLQAFQLLTCTRLRRDTHQSSSLLLAALSDVPQTPEAYAAALAVVLGPCLTVDVTQLEAHLRASATRRDGLHEAMRLKQLTVYSGRPRLRDRATTTEEQKARLDSSMGTWESYVGFCQLHQFPNVLSETVKGKLYFLASQTTWEWRPHVPSILKHEGGLCERLGQYPVSRPDLRLLQRCIDALCMDGRPPFQQMVDFKNRCFRSFPVSLSQRMTLSQVLRLYVCAYQSPHHWKELWKAQLCLLSPQIIKDCEAFAQEVPFAADAFMLHLAATP